MTAPAPHSQPRVTLGSRPKSPEGRLSASEAPRTKRPRGAVRAKIEALLDGTRTLNEIAEVADTSVAHVWTTAQRLDRMRDVRRVNAERGEDRGFWVAFPAPVRAWLEAEKPEGSTLAEFVRAIVQDAYDDAREGRG